MSPLSIDNRNFRDSTKEKSEWTRALIQARIEKALAAEQKVRRKALDEIIEREEEEIRAAKETEELRKRLTALTETDIKGSREDPSDSEKATGAESGHGNGVELAWDHSADKDSPSKSEHNIIDDVFGDIDDLEIEIPSPAVDERGILVFGDKDKSASVGYNLVESGDINFRTPDRA